MANLTIKTTQNIEIDFLAASLGDRILAFIIDMAIKIVYIIAVLFMFMTINLGQYGESISVLVWGLFSLPVIFYSLFFEVATQGLTPGKKVLKIKVLKIDGYQATFSDYFVRWILRVLDIVASTGVIAIISIIFTKDSQRLGDILGGTTVISTKEHVSLSASIYQEVEIKYVPKIPQVIKLSDTDIGVIKDILNRYLENKDYVLIKSLAMKLEVELGIDKTKLAINNEDFVRLVLKDYNHFTGRE